jgi:hypothetical protein
LLWSEYEGFIVSGEFVEVMSLLGEVFDEYACNSYGA